MNVLRAAGDLQSDHHLVVSKVLVKYARSPSAQEVESMGVTSGGDGGDASPPHFFCGGIVPPTFDRLTWEGPSPPH